MNRFLSYRRSVGIALAAAAAGWWLTEAWHGNRGASATSAEPIDNPAKPGWLPGSGHRSLGAAMAAVAAAGNADAQMAAAIALAAQLDPKDFATFLQNLRQLPAHSAQGLASRTVLRRWVAIDPAAALAWCVAHDRDLVGGVLDEWTRTAPPAQLVPILDQVPIEYRAHALASIFKSLAAHDPDAAITLLERSDAGQAIHQISRDLGQLAGLDPAWLIDRAESLPEHLRQSLRGVAVQSMAETNPDGAITWAMDQSDYHSLLGSLSRQPALLPALMAAMTELPEDGQRLVNLDSTVFYRLKGTELTSFIDALATHHGELSDQMVHRTLSRLSNMLGRADNPGTLANQLLALGNPGFQLSTFATAWADHSPAAARAWAASLTNEAQRTEAMQAVDFATNPPTATPPPPLAERVAQQAVDGHLHQFEQLIALTHDQRQHVLQSTLNNSLQNDPAANQNHGSAWQTISSRFPADAARALTQSLTPDNADAFIQPVAATASHYASENPQAAADWAAALPPGATRAWAAANVVGQWRLFDEPAARAWIKSLPPNEHAIATKGFSQKPQ